MLDHVFTDAIDALRQSLEQALLESLAVDEHFHADVFLGDLTWESSYGLLGEARPARISADLSLVWPTWSQSAFRDWCMDANFSDSPRIEIEVTLRVQRLVDTPDVKALLAATPGDGPSLGADSLYRSGPTIERSFGRDLTETASSFEVGYSGTYELSQDTLADPQRMDSHLAPLGGWVAAALVKLNDLELGFLPGEGLDDV